ncbi:type II toxin-antitoxin system RelB/DinJ family antitoxin [Eggerthella guodeyinii]|uniref:Type II toxin-antitoxin system RelB/DinJ family antitoxin n=1 Tax=Eggerthella guodeyinii TaxID=2690837 RepID=A0A6L7INU2_9ACTN|nr:type II toxin-antitoxin system RelB/DinJ family antitoxin [Eggerthella guodeyinii]QOS67697.1 type II toxin-antitoxin system RelB/DinJ family antitoxin [Eggerthella guodeyinii]
MAVVKEKKAARQTAGKTQVTCTAKKEVSDKPARADSIVTARVPSEIKEQGNAVLKKIGFTPTELVNAAYKYVLEHEELPSTFSSLEDLRGQHRTLTPEQKEKLQERMRAMTLKAPDGWGERPFKELLDEARGERYARFA